MKLFDHKFILLTVFIGIAALFSACAKNGKVASVGTSAADPLKGFATVNTNSDGIALQGFDAVAYFAVDNAVQGNRNYEYVWNGAKWLFSSEENMNKFKANPEAYAPQFGGYCSYAVSEGYTAEGDPEAWKVVDGKLYLNYSPKVKEKWEQNQSERIEKGERNWVAFKKKKPEHKG